ALGAGAVGRSGADGDEGAASDSTVEDALTDESGEGFVDGDDGDAVLLGEEPVWGETSAHRHLTGNDLFPKVCGDLLVERSAGSWVDAHAVVGSWFCSFPGQKA